MLKAAITVFLIWFVISKIDLGQFKKIMAQSNWAYLTLATLAFVVSKIISSIRLNNFLKVCGVEISEKFNLKLYWLGMFYNLFLPGGISGDGYKIYFLQKRFKTGTKKIFTAVLLDRVTGIVALFGLLVVISYFIDYPLVYKYWIWLLLPLSMLVFYFVLKWLLSDFVKVFERTNLMSFMVQLCQLCSAFFILLALRNSNSMMPYLFVFLVSSVVAIIPFTIGGIGSRELTFMIGAQWLHLDLNVSIALSFLFFLITAVVSLWGMVYSFSDFAKQESLQPRNE